MAGPRAGRGATMWRPVWALAWPAIGHMLLLSMVFVVDRLVLGRTDTTALASLQISTVVVWTLASVFSAFSCGTLAVAGRAFGAGDRRSAAQAVATSLLLAVAIGTGIAGVTLGTSAAWLDAVFPQAGAEVLGDVRAYLAIVVPALPLVFVEAVAAASLHAAGDTRTPLLVAAASNLVNLVLSCVLVFGLLGLPAMGVRGAAVGAVAAVVIQATLLVAALLARSASIPLREVLVTRAAWSAAVTRRVLRVGLPAFADKLAYSGGYMAFVALVAWLGPTAMAANQAISSVEAICFLSAEGFGVAAGALTAQSLGARAPGRAAQAVRAATTMAVAAVSALGLVFLAAPRALLSIFSADMAVVDAASHALVLAAVSQPFMAYATVTRMALRGAGATGSVLAVTLGGTFLVRMPLAYALGVGGGLGLTGVWIASTLDWIAQAVALAWLLRRGDWKSTAA